MTGPGSPLAIVTGARRGIGLAIAEALADKGFSLAITGIVADRQGDDALAAIRARGADAEFIVSDLSDIASHEATLARIVERFGRIDCLVNNAGISTPVRGDFLDLTADSFDAVMATNLRGTVFFTQAATRVMLQQAQGKGVRTIVNITSVSAEAASVDRLDYCMSKAAASMLTKGLALRLAGTGISVFEVRPGIIRTDMTAASAEKHDRFIASGGVPLGRWGEAGDIGSIVAELASGAFAFATGSVINADGGLSIARL
ncbi:MAG TPA: 3-ketoacyl-ACP reductase [Devosiaceae bacterium]